MPFISLRPGEVSSMLKSLGLNRLEDLFNHIPPGLIKDDFNIPEGRSQLEVEKELESIAGRNEAAVKALCFLGGGAYDHWCPPAVREILRRGEFYTAYTPYQPEIAQGVLQALFEYQTMMARLTGVEIANASLYDGATAVLEAALLSVRRTRRRKIVVDSALNPRYREVLQTGVSGLELEVVDVQAGSLSGGRDLGAFSNNVCREAACVIVPNPDFFGRMADLSSLTEPVHEAGALLVAVVSPLSSILFEPAGKKGADIVCGEAQELGLPMEFGGPYLGFMGCSKKLVRLIPGRLVGMTRDSRGGRAFTLTLQTREQHIRREKATSNICTNHSLCAFAAGLYLAAMGGEGLERAAGACLKGVALMREKLSGLPGVTFFPGTYFREFVFRSALPAEKVCRLMAEKGILAGTPLKRFYPEERSRIFASLPVADKDLTDGEILCAVTEKRSDEDIEYYVSTLREIVTCA